MNEIWIVAPGTNNTYEVSNMGRIRNSIYHNILSPNDTGKGYKSIRIANKMMCRSFKVHRLVMLAFAPIENPDEYTVHHKDFNPSNNRLDNLEWVSIADNIARSVKNGRYLEANKKHSTRMKTLTESGNNWLINRNIGLRGEKAPGAKLSDVQATDIRSRRFLGETCVSLAKEFNVSHQLISAICNNKVRNPY